MGGAGNVSVVLSHLKVAPVDAMLEWHRNHPRRIPNISEGNACRWAVKEAWGSCAVTSSRELVAAAARAGCHGVTPEEMGCVQLAGFSKEDSDPADHAAPDRFRRGLAFCTAYNGELQQEHGRVCACG